MPGEEVRALPRFCAFLNHAGPVSEWRHLPFLEPMLRLARAEVEVQGR